LATVIRSSSPRNARATLDVGMAPNIRQLAIVG
jgi:hypothetical protein